MTMVLEICVESVESAIAAEKGGAQRVELCSSLGEGGITPSAGLIQSVRSSIGIELFVMIRPRGGDFFYTDLEFNTMRYDIRGAKSLGADGVVLGLLQSDGQVDGQRTRQLVELAHPMQITFHRAFDMSANLEASLAQIVDTGAHRILTSGGLETVSEGAERIARLIQAAEGRIRVMVGSGIRPENIRSIALRTGATEFHCSLRTRIDGPVTFRNHRVKLGKTAEDEFARFVTLESSVRDLRRVLDGMEHASPFKKDGC